MDNPCETKTFDIGRTINVLLQTWWLNCISVNGEVIWRVGGWLQNVLCGGCILNGYIVQFEPYCVECNLIEHSRTCHVSVEISYLLLAIYECNFLDFSAILVCRDFVYICVIYFLNLCGNYLGYGLLCCEYEIFVSYYSLLCEHRNHFILQRSNQTKFLMCMVRNF